MDATLPTNSPVQQLQVPASPVPVSDQPLTLDPNQMPVEPPPARVAVQVPPVLGTPPVQQAPATPMSVGGHKERAPVFAPVSEYVRPSDVAPQLPQEVAEAGVEVIANREHPQLDATHQAAGIQHAPAAIPVVIPQTTSIYLPYSPAQVRQVEKESSSGDSRHWLAQLTEYILRKFQSFN